MEKLTPSRAIGQIYMDAAIQARLLANRATELGQRVKDKKDKNICRDNAEFAIRFANKATKASERTVTLLNDGALKDYCRQFDKVFLQFVQFAEECEKELNEIEQRAK